MNISECTAKLTKNSNGTAQMRIEYTNKTMCVCERERTATNEKRNKQIFNDTNLLNAIVGTHTQTLTVIARNKPTMSISFFVVLFLLFSIGFTFNLNTTTISEYARDASKKI